MRTKLPLPAAGILLLALFLAVTPQPSFAATCGLGLAAIRVQATTTSFGIYSPGAGAPTTTNGTISVMCGSPGTNKLPSFTVALDGGDAHSFNPRQMISTISAGSLLHGHLNYNLYTTSALSTVWGDGTGGTVTESYNSASGLSSISFTDYGSIPAGQSAPQGTYRDVIMVTVTF